MKTFGLRFWLILFVFLFLLSPSARAAGMVRVIVWLEGEPLAAYHDSHQPVLEALRRPFRAEDSELRPQAARLADLRSAVERRLSSLGFVTDGEADTVLHALFGRLPEDRLTEAAAAPGVRAVRLVREYRKLLDGAVPLINAPAAWQILGGESRAGRGMRVAILDTGVDINHPMMQDSSLTPPQGFPRGEPQFTNNKVIVARNYIQLNGDLKDTPNAMDRDGHGTFLASIAAGRRVIAPRAEVVGVAPGAFVGNYRIFNSPLSSVTTTDAAIIAALDDAVKDGMNVVNLSFGSLPFDLPSEEPVTQAAANTAKAGVIVVAAAGNDGPSPGTVSEPADSAVAIAVGASNNQRIFAHRLRVTAPTPVPDALAVLAAAHSDAPALTTTLGPLPVWAVSTRACSALGASDRVQNALALIEDGTCTATVKARNAAGAGARAALIYRRDSFDPQEITGLDAAPIPVFQMARSDAQALITFTGSTGQAQALIEPQVVSVPVQPDRLASFSSVGPNVDLELKPDLVAPGTNIYSGMQINDVLGFFYNPTQFGVSNGTSFSSAVTAGAALLVKQQHTDWTPAQVKSALVNTAANVVRQGAQEPSLTAEGNGRLDLAAAFRSGIAFDPVALSFSSRLLSAPVNFERRLTITNLGDAPESLTLEVKPRSELSNATVTVDPASIPTLRSRESATIRVIFTANPPVTSHRGSVDGRIQVRASVSGVVYAVPYWGEVVDQTIPSSVIRLRGDGQTQPVSTTLPQNFVVAVTDDDGVGKAGVPVKFSVAKGGGKLSATDAVTDFAGLASVAYTLGDVPGLNQMLANAAGDSTDFIATGRPNPRFPRAGVVHAASFTSALTPGSIVSVFGTGLAAGSGGAADLPLPRTLQGAQVLLNASPAPLFYASPTQINFQLPFELAGQSAADLRVAVWNTSSSSVSLPLSSAAPGLFTRSQNGQGTVVALHGADNSPVSSQSPATAGETVVLFGTGLGPVDPVVSSGAASPSNPPARTRSVVTARLGSVSVSAQFAGLAPGFVGLYQVNVQVPSGLTSGDVPLVLTVGSVSSNATTLPVR